ncbi:MAG: DNA-directed RNA polymerase subunit beta, partial [Synergistaceae bacterium]|nr:DNA-directed RNA polymerase subunit beta [Synergistaceae bacterium]
MPEFVPISKTRERYTFGRAHDVIEMPDMIEVQRDSYQWFYQDNEDPDLRASQGLQELLREVFPIKSYDGNYALEFVRYTIDKAKITEEEARQKDMTWARPIKATIRLTNMTTMVSKEDKEIFLGDFPIMTERGTFIINGTERVVINQLARSAGIYFTHAGDSCSAKLIPDRGAWLDFAMGPNEMVSANIDNRRRLNINLLLKALGAQNNEEIINLFDIQPVFMEYSEEMRGKIAAENVFDLDGRLLVAKCRPVTREALDILYNTDPNKQGGINVYDMDNSFALSFEKDTTKSPDEAKLEIFRKLRPNEPARVENARQYFDDMLQDPRRYTLGRVGRYKLNRRLNMSISEEDKLLTLNDVVAIIKEMFAMKID